MKVEPGNILKLFLNFSNFEPQYSYRLYSYKIKRVYAQNIENCTGIDTEIVKKLSKLQYWTITTYL